MIYSTPKVVPFTVDLHEHLVQVPAPFARLHAGNSAFSDLRREHWTEPMPPIPDCFVTDIDAALVQQILNISKGQWKTDVHHHRQADNLTARFEVAKWVRFGHPARLQNRPASLKLVLSDSALLLAKGGANHDRRMEPLGTLLCNTLPVSGKHYNTKRTHSALGYRPPAPEAIVPMDQWPVTH